MGIYAPSHQGFQSLLRIAKSSIADPPWFAAPVDAQEDQDSITIVFHVPGKKHGHVQVQAGDSSVTVWGDSRRSAKKPMRLCALACPVVPGGIETTRSGELVHVRVPKSRPAADPRESSRTP